jgi:rhamnose transport system ATP-binding protein
VTLDRPNGAAAAASAGVPALAARGVSRSFGPVRALYGVTVELHAGQIHAIVGENGAGKSTLTNILGGVLQPDEGSVEIRGEEHRLPSPAEALRSGIGIVFQELSLVPDMSVADNVMLGVQPRRHGLIDRPAQRRQVHELLERVDAGAIQPDRRVRELSVARQQLVEVAKVLARDPSVVIFDEPTAVLPADSAEELLMLIRRLAADGMAVGYISHRLAEVEAIADQVTVLRDGELVWTRPKRAVTLDGVVAAMVGRAVDEAFPERATTAEPTLMLEVDGVQLPGTEPNGINFTCRRGEILGVAGLVGSGRSRIARYLMGLEGDHGGEVRLDGQRYRPRDPRRAIRRGIMLVPEDRKGLGLILQLAIDRNIGLPSLDRLSRFGLIDPTAERELAVQTVSDLRIRTDDVTLPAENLSGGNQQKVVLGKWLARGPKLLILDEPLRGIDVSAKSEIHRILRELADAGLSILLISSELPEVLGLSDRVIVMRDGRIAATFEDRPFVPDEIMAVATVEQAS